MSDLNMQQPSRKRVLDVDDSKTSPTKQIMLDSTPRAAGVGGTVAAGGTSGAQGVFIHRMLSVAAFIQPTGVLDATSYTDQQQV